MREFPVRKLNELPMLTTNQLRNVDKIMVEKYGISVIRMMEYAGLGLAGLTRYLAMNKYATSKKIVIVAGKGHNGGDGFVAARHLYNWGFEVDIILSCPSSELIAIPLEQFNIVRAMPINYYEPDFESLSELLKQSDIIIDALLGFGITGAPRGATAMLITLINTLNKPVVSLDIPSGLDSTSGEVYTPCIKASETITLAMPKIGFAKEQSRSVLGDLYLSDIGVPLKLYRDMGIDMKPVFTSSNIIFLDTQLPISYS
jgi:NAD(P)H-hydrate epimerase